MSISFNRKLKILQKYNPGPTMYPRPHENEVWIFAPKEFTNGKLHHRPRLSLSFKKNKFHDWVSDRSGSLEKILDILNVSEIDKALLLDRTYESKNEFHKEIYYPHCSDLIIEINFQDNKIIVPQKLQKYYDYLKKRKLSILDLYVYDIKASDYYSSILFLGYDRDNNYQGFVAKNILKNYYYNQFSFKTLFFENLINFNKPIILVEGIFDAIRLKYNSIPMLGKNTNYIINRLLELKFNDKIYLILDSDVNFSVVRRLYDKLNNHFIASAINISKFNVTDPAELSEVQINAIKQNIKNNKYYELKDYIYL